MDWPADILQAARGRVLVYTGAGMSAASGIPTFRGAGGLYEGRDVSRLATPEGFAADPVLVWNWYAYRIRLIKSKQPNPGHHALVELENHAQNVAILTSNVDDLHHAAGSSQIERIHGTILQAKGVESGQIVPVDESTWPDKFETEDHLPRLPSGELLRPNVVWFGEYPWQSAFDLLQKELPRTTLFLEVGVSGQVSYGFTELATRLKIPTVRINPSPITQPGVTLVPHPSDEALPDLLARLV